MNRYPLWKYLVILAVIILGGLYSLPNLFPPDPAIQIAAVDSRYVVTPQVQEQAEGALDQAGIEHFGSELTEKNLLIRLRKGEQQLDAKAVVQQSIGGDYVVALNKAETTPDWLSSMGGQPMALGLDLSGGVHFLLEVDMDQYLDGQIEDYEANLLRELREEKIRYNRVTARADRSILVELRDQENLDAANAFIRSNFSEFLREPMENATGLVLTLTEQKLREMEDYALSQNLTTLKNRVNELGVAEPLVARQGRDRIVVELPGVQDTATALKILGKSANLEFRLEAEPGDRRAEIFEFRSLSNRGARTAALERSIIVTGDNVTDARVSYDQQGLPQVSVNLDSKGGSRMGQTTKNNVGRRMAVLFIEQKTRTTYELVNGEQEPRYESYTEKGIISLATIKGIFSTQFVIQGLDSPAEASELALLLRAGALAAPMKVINERTIGASLGQDNIDLGILSVVVGFVMVVIFMVAFYRLFGLFANVALTLNLVLIIAALSLMGATLTLPGIAGIVLTVGMAVDANVLIFSRIREELNNGLPPQSAINAGYDRAFVTILDANITTLIVAVILYAVGTGPIKGFAVTLSVGIITSMFTAIMLTRALTNMLLGGRQMKSLPIWEVWKWQK